MFVVTDRYLDPLSDFGFKHLFGRESNKEILLDFLNALFEGQKKILNIVYSPTEYAGEYKELKKVHFDILCTGENGEQFIIEMQRNNQLYFRERCIYYISRLFNQQLTKGESNWNIKLKEVYLIGILEFPLIDSDSNDFHHNICLLDRHTKKVFYDKFGIKFLELLNFNNQEDNLNTHLEKWMYVLKNLRHLDQIPDSLTNPIFKKIFKLAELANLTKEEHMEYDSGLKAYWDHQHALGYAEQQGKMEAKLETVHNLKKIGLPLTQISEVTGLSIDEIEKVK